MATLLDLRNAGAFSKLDALERGVQEFREFYASPELRRWINGTLPGLQSSWNIELSPLEQFVALAEIFCGGERIAYGTQFKPLNFIMDGIWELKTPDLRIFGWFPRKDCFVGVVADDATRIKTYKLYHGYANVTVRQFIEALDLDNPKCILGDNPHDVVSNSD
jgi:hypothetical protein